MVGVSATALRLASDAAKSATQAAKAVRVVMRADSVRAGWGRQAARGRQFAGTAERAVHDCGASRRAGRERAARRLLSTRRMPSSRWRIAPLLVCLLVASSARAAWQRARLATDEVGARAVAAAADGRFAAADGRSVWIA